MRVTGRDCGIIRNSFAGGVQSLHVWFTKNDPNAKLSEETAFHHDEYNAIPDGDALDFAELYYHQSGQELLDTINREMYLHLDADSVQYGQHHGMRIDIGPKFSFFKAPITNKYPFKSITILDAYNYMVIMQKYRQRPCAQSTKRKKHLCINNLNLLMQPFVANLICAPMIQLKP